MKMNRSETVQFVDTRSIGPGDVVLAMPREHFDPIELLAAADHADWMLLRLVLCAGVATLVLALATSLSR